MIRPAGMIFELDFSIAEFWSSKYGRVMLKPRFKVCFSARALISRMISCCLEVCQCASLIDELPENAVAFALIFLAC